MALFQNPLWGFEMTYPDEWSQRSHAGADGFAQSAEVFDQAGNVNEQAAYMLVRGEFNGYRKEIAPLWNQYITKLSVMLGAKKLGSAPFSMGGANGFEAEIQLPKKVNRRLWAGILARGTTILHLMVSHPREERESFEPVASQIISSLRFLPRVQNVEMNEKSLPLPPNYRAVSPQKFVPDAADADFWQAYDGEGDLGALEAFYFRELPLHGWEIQEFIPFPNQVDVDFARLRIKKDDLAATLGILPFGKKYPIGKIVVKYEDVD